MPAMKLSEGTSSTPPMPTAPISKPTIKQIKINAMDNIKPLVNWNDLYPGATFGTRGQSM
jgi:hypothetical protein